MHEESLIRSLLRQARDIAHLHRAIAVEEIEVEIGPLSGLEPTLLQDAFERLRLIFPWPDARLSVQETALEVLCRDCRNESQLENFHFVCCHCGSTALQILRGDGFRLLNMKLQVDDNCSDGRVPCHGGSGVQCPSLPE